MTDLTSKSKYLSFLLRHRPESANLTLDTEGWCNIVELMSNTDLTLDDILTIVRTDGKGRYSLRPADFVVPTHIRANQGHSSSAVKLTFKQETPPPVLFHGTSEEAWHTIQRQGLKPMKRHHVHLSTDRETALSVGGRRRGVVVLLEVAAGDMLAEGAGFYLSDNGVWLTDGVPIKFIRKI